MSEGGYFPQRNGRPWLIAAIVALLLPSISAIIIISQMHQKQTEFERRFKDRKAEFEERFKEHRDEAAHGAVAERLAEHDTLLNGQDRSLDTVRHSNDRLANDLYKMRTDLRVLEQQVDILHSYEDQP